jgi:endogenous inhibitor of DNA gyrase (YacG/DUF329 family)
MTNAIKLNCPTCKKQITWSEKYSQRPFCSARCKQIDFGDWAMARHSIAGPQLCAPEMLTPEIVDELENIRH